MFQGLHNFSGISRAFGTFQGHNKSKSQLEMQLRNIALIHIGSRI